MKQLGHQDLVSASYHHHGGWRAVRQRLGHPHRPIPSKKKPLSSYGKWARSRNNRRWALFQTFPEWTTWDVLPPEPLVVESFPGLVAFYQRQYGGWYAAGQEFGLLTGPSARQQRRYCLAVVEALEFYVTSERWPKSTECTNWLKHWRYQKRQTWDECLASLRPPRPMYQRLREFWHAYYRLIKQRRPQLKQTYLSAMNAFIIGNSKIVSATD